MIFVISIQQISYLLIYLKMLLPLLFMAQGHANGVVLITTKAGTSGKLKVNYNGQIGVKIADT